MYENILTVLDKSFLQSILIESQLITFICSPTSVHILNYSFIILDASTFDCNSEFNFTVKSDFLKNSLNFFQKEVAIVKESDNIKLIETTNNVELVLEIPLSDEKDNNTKITDLDPFCAIRLSKSDLSYIFKTIKNINSKVLEVKLQEKILIIEVFKTDCEICRLKIENVDVIKASEMEFKFCFEILRSIMGFERYVKDVIVSIDDDILSMQVSFINYAGSYFEIQFPRILS